MGLSMVENSGVSRKIIVAMSRNLAMLGVRGRRRTAYAIEFIGGALAALQAVGLHDCAAQVATDAAIAVASNAYDTLDELLVNPVEADPE